MLNLCFSLGFFQALEARVVTAFSWGLTIGRMNSHALWVQKMNQPITTLKTRLVDDSTKNLDWSPLSCIRRCWGFPFGILSGLGNVGILQSWFSNRRKLGREIPRHDEVSRISTHLVPLNPPVDSDSAALPQLIWEPLNNYKVLVSKQFLFDE